MLPEQFSRTAMLLGPEGVQRLSQAKVAVFGVGGVGSYAVEALARVGVGHLILVDDDVVVPSNLNRQLHATMDTLGISKVEAMAQRIRSINPQAKVTTYQTFCLPENVESLLEDRPDYILDAVDTVSAKLALAQTAYEQGIPIIAAMGAGNKLDPTQFQVADLYKTSVCPLCRVMRRELKRRGVPSLKVVYSQEEPKTPLADAFPGGAHAKRQTPGSVSFVPSVAGLILAGEAVRDLLGITR